MRTWDLEEKRENIHYCHCPCNSTHTCIHIYICDMIALYMSETKGAFCIMCQKTPCILFFVFCVADDVPRKPISRIVPSYLYLFQCLQQGHSFSLLSKYLRFSCLDLFFFLLFSPRWWLILSWNPSSIPSRLCPEGQNNYVHFSRGWRTFWCLLLLLTWLPHTTYIFIKRNSIRDLTLYHGWNRYNLFIQYFGKYFITKWCALIKPLAMSWSWKDRSIQIVRIITHTNNSFEQQGVIKTENKKRSKP